jgi:hypothetical protein
VRPCPAAGYVETALPFPRSTAIHAVMFRVTLLLLVACAVASAVEIAAEDPHGRRPTFDSSWGTLKVPRAVERALRERLADPSSLQITKLVSLEKAEYQGTKCYQMILNFSGRNRMGGVTPMAAMAYVRDSRLLGIQMFED